jgi:hypothetical protein
MKRNVTELKVALAAVNPHHVRLGLVVISLALFVLGAGAPNGHGG